MRVKMAALPEGSGSAIGLFSAPSLALVQRQIADGVVSCTAVVELGEFLESHASCSMKPLVTPFEGV